VCEVRVLPSDQDAPEVADQFLRQYPKCAYVAVWDAERPVLVRHRHAAGVARDRPVEAR
jgi:hypothetical protein